MHSNKLIIFSLVFLSSALSAMSSDSDTEPASFAPRLNRHSFSGRKHTVLSSIHHVQAPMTSNSLLENIIGGASYTSDQLAVVGLFVLNKQQVKLKKLELERERLGFEREKFAAAQSTSAQAVHQKPVDSVSGLSIAKPTASPVRAFGFGLLAGATVIGGLWALKQNPEGAANLRSLFSFKKA